MESKYTDWEKEIIERALTRIIWEEHNIKLLTDNTNKTTAPDFTVDQEIKHMEQRAHLVQKLYELITGK